MKQLTDIQNEFKRILHFDTYKEYETYPLKIIRHADLIIVDNQTVKNRYEPNRSLTTDELVNRFKPINANTPNNPLPLKPINGNVNF